MSAHKTIMVSEWMESAGSTHENPKKRSGGGNGSRTQIYLLKLRILKKIMNFELLLLEVLRVLCYSIHLSSFIID